MASLSRAKNGTRTLQFINHVRQRKTIRLGKMSLESAKSLKARVEALANAQANGVAMDADLCGWLAKISADLHEKLATVGLVESRVAKAPPVEVQPFVEA